MVLPVPLASSTGPDFSSLHCLQVCVQRVFQTWGSGGYAGDDQMKNLERDVAADCFYDASGPHKNTDGYRVYRNLNGAKQWTDFLMQVRRTKFRGLNLAGTDCDERRIPSQDAGVTADRTVWFGGLPFPLRAVSMNIPLFVS